MEEKHVKHGAGERELGNVFIGFGLETTGCFSAEAFSFLRSILKQNVKTGFLEIWAAILEANYLFYQQCKEKLIGFSDIIPFRSRNPRVQNNAPESFLPPHRPPFFFSNEEELPLSFFGVNHPPLVNGTAVREDGA